MDESATSAHIGNTAASAAIPFATPGPCARFSTTSSTTRSWTPRRRPAAPCGHPLRKRFYARAAAGAGTPEGGFPIALDGKPVRTPLRRPLAAPAQGPGRAIAGGMDAQEQVIDPGTLPLTRLANAVIDAVADATGAGSGRDRKVSRLRSHLLPRRRAPPG